MKQITTLLQQKTHISHHLGDSNPSSPSSSLTFMKTHLSTYFLNRHKSEMIVLSKKLKHSLEKELVIMANEVY